MQDGNVQRSFSPGRPRITNDNQDIAMVEYLKNNPFSFATRAAALENVPYRTALRRIHEKGLGNSAAAHETELTPQQKQARIIHCRYMLDVFREDNFSKIIYTDEKTFKSDKNNYVRVWRPKNQRYKQKYVYHYKLSGHLTAGYWGWMSLAGPGELVEIGGHFNQDAYLEILEEVALPSIEAQFGSTDNIIFMHDNSPVHTARRVREFLESRHIQVLNHPAMSPDLNLIENVWSLMERDRPKLIERTHEKLNEHVFTRWEDLRRRQGKFAFNSALKPVRIYFNSISQIFSKIFTIR